MNYLSFIFNDTATTETYTLSLPTLFRSHSLHRRGTRSFSQTSDGADAGSSGARENAHGPVSAELNYYVLTVWHEIIRRDRKSTRLNSSHSQISYAVFCLKKKK